MDPPTSCETAVTRFPCSFAPFALALAVILVVLAGCGRAADTTGRVDATSPPAATSSAAAAISLEPAQTEDPEALLSPGADTDRPRTTQTDTAWGRIWDRLPDDFPRYPGSQPADETSPETTSGVFAIPGRDAPEIAGWFQNALELATYSTEALSGPLEDGSHVLDSAGEAGCRIQVTVAPLGSTTNVLVRYGADCPNT